MLLVLGLSNPADPRGEKYTCTSYSSGKCNHLQEAWIKMFALTDDCVFLFGLITFPVFSLIKLFLTLSCIVVAQCFIHSYSYGQV